VVQCNSKFINFGAFVGHASVKKCLSLKNAAAQFPKLVVFVGKLVRRQRLPKNDVGDFWSWKDLNISMNLPCYGRVFRIYDCDRWTWVCVAVCLFISYKS